MRSVFLNTRRHRTWTFGFKVFVFLIRSCSVDNTLACQDQFTYAHYSSPVLSVFISVSSGALVGCSLSMALLKFGYSSAYCAYKVLAQDLSLDNYHFIFPLWMSISFSGRRLLLANDLILSNQHNYAGKRSEYYISVLLSFAFLYIYLYEKENPPWSIISLCLALGFQSGALFQRFPPLTPEDISVTAWRQVNYVRSHYGPWKQICPSRSPWSRMDIFTVWLKVGWFSAMIQKHKLTRGWNAKEYVVEQLR